MGGRRHGETMFVGGMRIATPEYRTWQALKNRCTNPRGQDWRHYGGRGITIDPRWNKFENFLADMGRRPTERHTLDRTDNDGPYTKSNCQWSTRTTQARNRRCNKLDKHTADQIRSLYSTSKYRQIDLAAIFGVNQTLISSIVRGKTWG
jgi:hypothetical protein